MPTRSNLKPAVSLQVLNKAKTYGSVGNLVGTWQSISALNNVGRFIPGVYRANAVVLQKHNAFSSPASSTGEDRYLSNKGHLSGDLAAILANTVSHGPLSSNWASYYGAWDSSAAGQSLQKAWARMNESDLDVGVMLGELRETLELLRSPFSALKKYHELKKTKRLINDIKSFGARNKARLDMLSGSWLEYRYGLMPLIYTIEDILEQIREHSQEALMVMLRKRGRVMYNRQYKTPLGNTTVGNAYNISGSGTIEVTHKYVSSVCYQLKELLTWQERYGLDLSAMPGIAWELTKLSFVWDWMFSVGLWLQSLRVSTNRTVLGCTTSHKMTATLKMNLESAQFFNVVPAAISGSSYELTYQLLDRRVNPVLPISPVINRESLSLKRTIDALSLIWQNMPNLKRK